MSSREQRDLYDQIKARWPHLFVNHPGSGCELLYSPELVAAESMEEARLRGRGLPTSWSLTGVVHEDPYLILLRDAVRWYDGALGTYVRIIPANGYGGAAALPLCGGKIVLLRHFRHATRRWQLEIPRAVIELGMQAAETVSQEMREEFDVDASNLIDLGPFHSDTGITAYETSLFLAETSTPGSPQTAEGIGDIELHTPYRLLS